MLLYLLYMLAQSIVLILPLGPSYRLAALIADIHFYTSKKDRRLVINNLKCALGRNDNSIRQSGRAILRNFAKYLVEFLRFRKMDKAYIKKFVKVEGLDNLRRALEKNRGVIMFSAHLGNWEWGAAIVAQLGFPINAIVLAHKDKNVNRLFVEQRRLMGIKNIPLGGSVRKSLEALNKNEIIAILCDRDFSNNAVPVDFFGKESLMPVGLGILAIKKGCPLIPTFMIRQKDDTHKLIIDKPLEYAATGDKEKDIKNILQEAIRAIEGYVRRYPEQWFIFDDPWKRQRDAV